MQLSFLASKLVLLQGLARPLFAWKGIDLTATSAMLKYRSRKMSNNMGQVAK
jgi:hypothetical protein